MIIQIIFILNVKSCGAILHIENPIVKQMDLKIEKEYGVLVDSTKTILYGICARCKGEKTL